MAENQEYIESRLCGYVEETLDPAEKAEIEAHLLAHPQQRQLLVELRQMREALAALPRESAPAEMSESFTGQLERSVLLDGIGQPSVERRMRITRMPQYAAVAAIVMLAAGLGFVIYYTALPSGKSSMAQNTHAPAISPNSDGASESLPKPPSAPIAPAGGGGDQAPLAQATPPVGPQPGPLLPSGREVSHSGSAVEEGKGTPLIALAEAPPQIAAAANSALTNRSVRALLGRANGADESDRGKPSGLPTLVMVVATADPGATTRKLGNYLESNNADWQTASSLDAVAKSVSPAFGNGAGPSAPGSLGAGNARMEAAAGASSGDKQGAPATMPQTMPDAFASAGAAANAPTTGPYGLQQQSQIVTNAMKDDHRPVNGAKDLQNQLGEREGDRLYVVHNLSYQQAKALSDVLRQGVQDGEKTQAPLFAESADDDTFDAKARRPGAEVEQQQQRDAVAPTDDLSATEPDTRPRSIDLANNQDQQTDLAEKAPPTTGPSPSSASAPPASGGIVALDNQALLGSSPVDLVIVIQPAPAAAAPTTAPAVIPATAPATEPATAPANVPVMPPIAN